MSPQTAPIPSLTRVYVPVTQLGLDTMCNAGHLSVTEAFAVTDRLRASLALSPDDPEGSDELSEAALVAAADACLALLAAEPGAWARRVVIAADVLASPDTSSQAHPGAVDCPEGISLSAVACVLADDPTDAEAVAAVSRAMATQGANVDQLEAALDALDEYPLAWFDASELPQLAAGGS